MLERHLHLPGQPRQAGSARWTISPAESPWPGCSAPVRPRRRPGTAAGRGVRIRNVRGLRFPTVHILVRVRFHGSPGPGQRFRRDRTAGKLQAQKPGFRVGSHGLTVVEIEHHLRRQFPESGDACRRRGNRFGIRTGADGPLGQPFPDGLGQGGHGRLDAPGEHLVAVPENLQPRPVGPHIESGRAAGRRRQASGPEDVLVGERRQGHTGQRIARPDKRGSAAGHLVAGDGVSRTRPI